MSKDEILKIIKLTPNKSCDLNPIPTSLVLDWMSVLLTCITNIVNYSLQEGSFTSFLKTANVTPLLKKAGLDRKSLKKYQPVSNLCYISKLIEKAVAKQIKEHIDHEGIANINQPAYELFTLLKQHYKTTLPPQLISILLDLSAAFDTIDNTILFDYLQHWYDIDGVVLIWVQSDFNSRKQRIKVYGLPYGVSQGSVLGPLCYDIQVSFSINHNPVVHV